MIVHRDPLLQVRQPTSSPVVVQLFRHLVPSLSSWLIRRKHRVSGFRWRERIGSGSPRPTCHRLSPACPALTAASAAEQPQERLSLVCASKLSQEARHAARDSRRPGLGSRPRSRGIHSSPQTNRTPSLILSETRLETGPTSAVSYDAGAKTSAWRRLMNRICGYESAAMPHDRSDHSAQRRANVLVRVQMARLDSRPLATHAPIWRHSSFDQQRNDPITVLEVTGCIDAAARVLQHGLDAVGIKNVADVARMHAQGASVSCSIGKQHDLDAVEFAAGKHHRATRMEIDILIERLLNDPRAIDLPQSNSRTEGADGFGICRR